MSLWDKTEYDLIQGVFAGDAGGTEIVVKLITMEPEKISLSWV